MIFDMITWAALGMFLASIGFRPDGWQFWGFVAIFIAMTKANREFGKIQGMVAYLEMTAQEQTKIKQALTALKDAE